MRLAESMQCDDDVVHILMCSYYPEVSYTYLYINMWICDLIFQQLLGTLSAYQLSKLDTKERERER